MITGGECSTSEEALFTSTLLCGASHILFLMMRSWLSYPAVTTAMTCSLKHVGHMLKDFSSMEPAIPKDVFRAQVGGC